MRSLVVTPIKTNVFRLAEDVVEFVLDSLPEPGLREGDVLAITSKIVSLSESRLVQRDSIDKRVLIEQEADQVLAELAHNCTLTLKHGLMMISAGIDESNSPTGEYILYPVDPWAAAANILKQLKAKYAIKNLGIILTDSHTIPLRRGVVGISLAHAGFRGTKNCIGEADLFGRPLKFTHQDLADGLAAAAVLVMGEGNECQPLALIENAEVIFLEGEDDSPLRLRPEEDLYYPFFAGTLPDNEA